MLYLWIPRIQHILNRQVSFTGRCASHPTSKLDRILNERLLLQAPEMRSGSYNSLKVDVWSLGATAWEMAECIPPFMDMDISDPRRLPKQWPPLSEKNRWSSDFEEFLGLCSRPERERPGPMDLIAVSLGIPNNQSMVLIIRFLTIDTIHCFGLPSRTRY